MILDNFLTEQYVDENGCCAAQIDVIHIWSFFFACMHVKKSLQTYFHNMIEISRGPRCIRSRDPHIGSVTCEGKMGLDSWKNGKGHDHVDSMIARMIMLIQPLWWWLGEHEMIVMVIVIASIVNYLMTDLQHWPTRKQQILDLGIHIDDQRIYCIGRCETGICCTCLMICR